MILANCAKELHRYAKECMEDNAVGRALWKIEERYWILRSYQRPRHVWLARVPFLCFQLQSIFILLIYSVLLCFGAFFLKDWVLQALSLSVITSAKVHIFLLLLNWVTHTYNAFFTGLLSWLFPHKLLCNDSCWRREHGEGTQNFIWGMHVY